MMTPALVEGSQTPTCNRCSELRRWEVNALIFDASPTASDQWRRMQRQHIADAHRPVAVPHL